MCWAGLPSLWGRTFRVASLGVSAPVEVRSTPCVDGVLLAGGPGLAQTTTELDALEQLWSGVPVIRTTSARSVRAALPAVGVVHLAAHASLRADNPLQSRVDFDDGPLSLEEILETRARPCVVYLSNCSLGGTSEQYQGSALAGALPILTEHGVGEVVAASTPLLDEHAPRFAQAVHARIRAGGSAAQGLADARASIDRGDDRQAGMWASLAAMSVTVALP